MSDEPLTDDPDAQPDGEPTPDLEPVEPPRPVIQLDALFDGRNSSPPQGLIKLTAELDADDAAATPVAAVVAGLRVWAGELEAAHGLTPPV